MTNKHLFFGMQKLFLVAELSKQTIGTLKIINFLTQHERLTKLLIPTRFPTRPDKVGIVEIITMMRNIAAASKSSLSDVYNELFEIMIKRMVRNVTKKLTIPD